MQAVDATIPDSDDEGLCRVGNANLLSSWDDRSSVCVSARLPARL
jgi:hypothetical protein